MDKLPYINYNGSIMHADDYTFSNENRAFLYGDGLFESIRVINGQPCFFEDHYKRFTKGCEAIGIVVPENYTVGFFENQIATVLDKNNVDKGARLRLHIFRAAGGFYTPKNNELEFIIEVAPLLDNQYTLPEKGVQVDVFREEKKLPGLISRFKTKSALIYVMAQNHAIKNNMDESLIINDKDFVIESATSNIFLVSNGVLYTPALKDGCVAGVMRKQIINLAIESNIKVYESALTPQHLLSADEVFLTNAMGVRWVKSFKMQRYYHKLSDKLIRMINERVTSLKQDSQESLK